MFYCCVNSVALMLTSVCCGSLAGSFICVQILDEVFGENLIIWVVFIFSLLNLYLTLHLKLIVPLLAILRTGIVPLSPVLYQKAFSKRLFPSYFSLLVSHQVARFSTNMPFHDRRKP